MTIIYFPNNGYLDDDYIYPGELDDNEYVEIEGEESKTYEVQIDYLDSTNKCNILEKM